MRALDFNRLPPDTRERIVACFEGKAPPYAILSQKESAALGYVGWAILALLGLLGLASISYANFGQVYGFHQPFVMFIGYAFCVFVITASVLRILRVNVRKGALPFAPGVYLFPLDLVIADDATLKIHPLTELKEMQPTHHYRNGIYQNTSFRFTFQTGKAHTLYAAPKPKAEQALTYFREVRMKVVEVAEKQDFQTLMAMDLFASARMNDSWDKFQPAAGIQAKRLPMFLQRVALISLAPALVLGLMFYFVRNFVSDEAAFRSLQTYASTPTCETYIRAGGRHADEVKRVTMPRALLNEMVQKKSSLAIRYCLKKYENSAIQADAMKALDEAIAADFTAAKEKSSVTALREFLRDNPGAPQEPQARAEIHALFQKSLTDFKAKASASDPNLVPFVEQLLTHLEKFDSPPVSVRFVRIPTDSLLRADRVIESGLNPVERAAGFAKASPHFDEASSRTREQTLVKLLQDAFETVFPADILTFVRDAGKISTGKPKTGTEMTAEEIAAEYKRRTTSDLVYVSYYDSTQTVLPVVSTETLPTANSPAMLLKYKIDWSGTTYSSQQTHRMFVGILSDFDVSMAIPNVPLGRTCPARAGSPNAAGTVCPLAFKLTVRPPKEFDVQSSSFINKDAVSAPDDLVYEVMAARAYDELSEKLQGAFFGGNVLVKSVGGGQKATTTRPSPTGTSSTATAPTGTAPTGANLRGTGTTGATATATAPVKPGTQPTAKPTTTATGTAAVASTKPVTPVGPAKK